MFCALVRKRLTASCNQTDHIIIMTMPRIGVLDIISMQKLNIELGVMRDFRPFLGLHHHSVLVLYHNLIFRVLHDIALFEKPSFDNQKDPAKIVSENCKFQIIRFCLLLCVKI